MPLRGRGVSGDLTLFDLDVDHTWRDESGAASGRGGPDGGEAAADSREAPVEPAAQPSAASRFMPAQAAAIDERAHSLLLSAAAGSGKTSVLVERFVRAVLDDEVDPGRILAITFTDKAAGELRERIRRRFEEIGTSQARAAARATEGAFVSTIHGFCSRLLRAHPLAAGLDPGFSVLDEPRAARLRDAAFATALRGFLQSAGQPALDLVAAYRTDALALAIPAIHDELRSRGQALPHLPPVERRPPPDAERTALAAAHAAFAAELASARDSKLVDDARAALERCARFLEDVEAGVVPWPGRMRAMDIACGRAAALDTAACHAYVEARDTFERACADHHAARHVALLDDLLGRFGRAYSEAKAARGALDFDDLELRARDLLAAHPAVRAHWRERFVLVMVDEFQDTNRRQLEILQALEDDQVFSVGDEFQSIYGFRHADVDIFRARRAELAQRGLALRLEESFRCAPEILAAVNAAFAQRFGEHFAPLRSPRAPAPLDEPRVELLLTTNDGWDDVDLGDTLPPVADGRKAEARLIAQRLRELVDRGDAAPGDIAILVRASASMPVLEGALADVGLPSLATAGRGFWTRQEVVDLMAYLSALANPLDEPSLLAVLGSPLCGVSSDTLALLVQEARAAREDVWSTLRAAAAQTAARGDVEATRDAVPAQPAPREDRERLVAFAARFAAERAAIPRRRLDELMERAIAASGYDLTLLGLAGGARRMANVDKLLRLARGFEAAEGRDLRAFVEHAGALEDAQKREPEAAVEDPDLDAVRLMTVHAAKGLEFGVVVVADLGRLPNRTTPLIQVDGERVGLRLSLLDGAKATPALDYPQLEAQRRERESAEEQRVLYVALTRAKERLLLSGSVANLMTGGHPLTWLGPALVPDLPARVAAETPEAHARIDGPGCELALTLSTPATFGDALRPDFAAPRPVLASAVAPAPPVAPAPLPADGPGPPPGAATTLSYTALSAYLRCGYRFYVQRVVGLPDQPAPPGVLEGGAAAGAPTPAPTGTLEHGASRGGLEARVRGTIVHALLEELDDVTGAAVDPQRIRALAEREGAVAGEADLADVTSLVAAFAASATARRLGAARRLRREHQFAFTLGERLMVGVIDALAVEEDGTWLIVDVKTDRLDDPATDLEKLVQRDYVVQRELYALAALRAGAERVEVVHLYLQRPDRPATARYSAADAERLAARLQERTARLSRGEYPLTEHPHAELCATCPARGGLCPYPPERTLAPGA
jgi:ATP-dependent exoDNAse (exonuclease V) beta subunit